MLEGGRAKIGTGENGLGGSLRKKTKKTSCFSYKPPNVEWQRRLLSAELPLVTNTPRCRCGEQQVVFQAP